MEKRTNRKLLCPGIILILFLAVICALVYKAQIRESLRQPIEYTMMTEHKDTFEVVLSKGMTAISEVFVCKVPELKSFSIELTGKNVVDEAELVMTLADVDTKEIYFQKKEQEAGQSSGWMNPFGIQKRKNLSSPGSLRMPERQLFI